MVCNVNTQCDAAVKPEHQTRLSRNRMILAKVVQNVSSGVVFGDKVIVL